jgi:hypothetical protein
MGIEQSEVRKPLAGWGERWGNGFHVGKENGATSTIVKLRLVVASTRF